MTNSAQKINKSRILRNFFDLAAIDSESYNEKRIAAHIKKLLDEIGLAYEEDSAAEKLLEEQSAVLKQKLQSGQARTLQDKAQALQVETRPLQDKEQTLRTKDLPSTASNIYARLKGNGPAILFSSHLDTVSPGIGKKPILHSDGSITSSGNTVLGADDISGLVSILEAVRVIKEENLPHPDIELLFTVAEEPYGRGSRFIEYDRLTAKQGYVLDLTGEVGTAALRAPSIIEVTIKIKGRSAHAGFEPEKGINALNIAANALARIKTGRIDDDLTVNFGKISGGTGRNIIPEEIEIAGEIRCLEPERALAKAKCIRQIFEEEAGKIGGTAEVNVDEKIRAYAVKTESPVVKRFLEAAERARCSRPECITTFGGSDANRLNQNGVESIVIACGMQKCHTKDEYTTIDQLVQSTEITLNLMTATN